MHMMASKRLIQVIPVQPHSQKASCWPRYLNGAHFPSHHPVKQQHALRSTALSRACSAPEGTHVLQRVACMQAGRGAALDIDHTPVTRMPHVQVAVRLGGATASLCSHVLPKMALVDPCAPGAPSAPPHRASRARHRQATPAGGAPCTGPGCTAPCPGRRRSPRSPRRLRTQRRTRHRRTPL